MLSFTAQLQAEGHRLCVRARTGRCKAGFRSFGDQVGLEFRERGEDAEHQLARRRGNVDRRTVARQHHRASSRPEARSS